MIEKIIKNQIPKLNKLKVQKEEYNKYHLIGKDKEYYFYIDFFEYDADNLEYIYMSNELLDELYSGYSQMYSFGPVNGKYCKKLNLNNIMDLILVEKNSNITYLQRYYG